MAVRTIIHYPAPLLKQVSKPVLEFDAGLKQLADDMVETMYDAPGVGLAAPQVGELVHLVVMDCSGKDESPDLIVAVNPQIVEKEGTSCEEEGCLSVPGYYATVNRYSKVTMKFQDVAGHTHQRSAEGLLAVAMQHEIDHLQGILFVDHLSPLKKSLFRKKYKKMMMEKEEE